MLNKIITIPSIIWFKAFNTLFQILILTMYQTRKLEIYIYIYIKSLTSKNAYRCDEILVKILKLSIYYLYLDLHM